MSKGWLKKAVQLGRKNEQGIECAGMPNSECSAPRVQFDMPSAYLWFNTTEMKKTLLKVGDYEYHEYATFRADISKYVRNPDFCMECPLDHYCPGSNKVYKCTNEWYTTLSTGSTKLSDCIVRGGDFNCSVCPLLNTCPSMSDDVKTVLYILASIIATELLATLGIVYLL